LKTDGRHPGREQKLATDNDKRSSSPAHSPEEGRKETEAQTAADVKSCSELILAEQVVAD
jgi:hypothetical protein